MQLPYRQYLAALRLLIAVLDLLEQFEAAVHLHVRRSTVSDPTFVECLSSTVRFLLDHTLSCVPFREHTRPRIFKYKEHG